MCFNAEVSIITYIIGMIGSILLFKKNYKPEAIFYGWVIQMQFIEFLLWKNQPCPSDKNIKISETGMIINHLEPIILWLAILFFSRRKLPIFINVLMLIFIVSTFLYSKNIKIQCTTVSAESKPHLHWKWNSANFSIPYYLLFLICLILLSYYGFNKGYINALIVLISFIISFMIYGNKNVVGAMWCFFAAFGPWVLLYLYSR